MRVSSSKVRSLALLLLLEGAARAQTTERISVSSTGAQSQGFCGSTSISRDGRFVAFGSSASDLVTGDTNGVGDVFVRDRLLGTTERVDLDSGGAQANEGGGGPSISGDGRFVTFASGATNLVPGDTNGVGDVFVRDRHLGLTDRVSLSSTGVQGNDYSFGSVLSDDGRYVAFVSNASNLAPGESNPVWDVFVRDRQLGTTQRVSETLGGTSGNGMSFVPSISADGRFVAFTSESDDLAPNDFNGKFDVFVRDLQLGSLALVSVDSSGFQGNERSQYGVLSSNGRFVTFYSESDLDPSDTSLIGDVYVRDLQLGITERVSVDAGGGDPNQFSFSVSGGVSDDGRYVLFSSDATDLVAGDTNGSTDSFLRDRAAVTSFTSVCDAGVGGVMACPCGNPPAGAGRGCDNSAGTGGAVLSASASTSLSFDTLVFTTSGERAAALSIVSQWTAPATAGLVFGQGVRCAMGALKRLYVKSAVGGSITAPNFAAGDPSVSLRSAALGDSISAGQSRWYLVYYRDGVVVGGCPATSTFNATQTGVVIWSP